MTEWHDLAFSAPTREALQRLARNLGAVRDGTATAPVRVLLWGPPGCGKTAVQRALIEGTGLTPVVASQQDFRGAFLGQTSQAVRDLFARARAKAPALLTIDALDWVVRRGDTDPRVSECLTQMLVELDGRDQKTGALCIVAEAHDPNHVDAAVLARGFDLIEIPLPDEASRASILRRAIEDVPRSPSLDVEDTARMLAAHLVRRTGRDLDGLIHRSRARAAQRADDAGGDAAAAVLTLDLLLEDEALRAGGDSTPGHAVPHRPLPERAAQPSATPAPQPAPPPVEEHRDAFDGLHLQPDQAAALRRCAEWARLRETLAAHGIETPRIVLVARPSSADAGQRLGAAAGLPLLRITAGDLLARERGAPGYFRGLLESAAAWAPGAVLVTDAEYVAMRRGSRLWSADTAAPWSAITSELLQRARTPSRPYVLLILTTTRLDEIDQSLLLRAWNPWKLTAGTPLPPNPF